MIPGEIASMVIATIIIAPPAYMGITTLRKYLPRTVEEYFLTVFAAVMLAAIWCMAFVGTCVLLPIHRNQR